MGFPARTDSRAHWIYIPTERGRIGGPGTPRSNCGQFGRSGICTNLHQEIQNAPRRRSRGVQDSQHRECGALPVDSNGKLVSNYGEAVYGDQIARRGDILGLVTRLIKWSVAGHGLPSGRFPIRYWRAVWPACSYRSGRILNSSGDLDVANRSHLQFICISTTKVCEADRLV